MTDPHRPEAQHDRHNPARKDRRETRRNAVTDRSGDNRAEAGANGPGRRDGAASTESADARKPADIAGYQVQGEGQRPERSSKQPGGGKLQNEKHPGQAEEDAGAEGEADREEPPGAAAAALGKEAAFLKAAEDTEGGQGAMLFSEFVEALARLCLVRYGPRVAARTSRVAVALGKVAGRKKLGVGGRRTVTAQKMSFVAKSVARGRRPHVRLGSGRGQDLSRNFLWQQTRCTCMNIS